MKKMNKRNLILIALLLVGIYNLSSQSLVYAEEATPTPTITVTQTPTPRPTKPENTKRTASLIAAQELATRIFTNQFLAKLNALRAKVNSNEKINAEAKVIILAKIDSELIWFNTQKDSIDTATTLLQVRTIVREARSRFIQIGKDIRKLHIAHGFTVSLEKIVENVEKNILPKIEAKLLELSNKGTVIVTEQAFFDTAKSELTLVKSEIAEIKASTSFEQAKKNFDEAKVHLKKVKQSLKDLLVSLKAKL